MQQFEEYKLEGIHFRSYGKGAPLILLHPSPNSGKMFHEFAQIQANNFMVICPDTPGYGDSDDLDSNTFDMEDYASKFKVFFKRLGFDKISIYGSATGSQIAIKYGIMFPEDITHLYLDNCAHFSDEERIGIYEHYFPDFTPVRDGAHLREVWNLVSNLFVYFPWCFQTDDYKLNTPIPPVTMLHAIALDYLMAGKGYDKAYRAAFEHEKVENMQKLEVPATIFRWKGSILSKYTDRLFDYPLPSQIDYKYISAPRDQRYNEMAEAINESSSKGQKANIISWNFDPLSSQANEKPKWLCDLGAPPAPNSTGSHLDHAWKAINETGQCEDALEIQTRLIQWYT